MQNAEQLLQCTEALVECRTRGDDLCLVFLEQLLETCAVVLLALAFGFCPVQQRLLLAALAREIRFAFLGFL